MIRRVPIRTLGIVPALLLLPLLVGSASGSSVARGSIYQTWPTVKPVNPTHGRWQSHYVFGMLSNRSGDVESAIEWDAGAADVTSERAFIKTMRKGYDIVVAGVESSDSITVKVTGNSDEVGIAYFANTMDFEIQASVGGGKRHVVNGKVVCTDILSKKQTFSYDLNWGECNGVPVTVDNKTVQWSKVAAGGGANVTLSTGGASASASVNTSGESGVVNTSQSSATVVPVPGQSTTAPPAPQKKVTDASSGMCEYQTYRSWSSNAKLTLGVEGYATGTMAQTAVTTYEVKNDCSASWLKIGPGLTEPPDPEPPAPDEDDPQYTPPANQLDSGGPYTLALETNTAIAIASNATLPSNTGVAIVARMPIGLGGETGARPGLLFVDTEVEASEDLEFSLATIPSGVTDLPATVVVPEGTLGESVAFNAVVANSNFVIRATLLDNGVPATPLVEMNLGAAVESVSTISAPTIEAGILAVDGGHVLEDARITAPMGESLGYLAVSRTGFDNFDSEDTTVTVTVSDPNSIFASVPSAITIAAGEEDAEVLVELNSTAGDAMITLTYGTQSIALPVRSAAHAWSSPVEAVRLPVNGTTIVPVHFDLPHRQDHSVTVVAADPSVFSTEDLTLPANYRFAHVPITGDSVGVSQVSISSGALADISLPVDIRAEEVAVDSGVVTLSQLSGSNGGAISLVAPDGITFDAAVPAAGSGSFMTVTGVGTGVLTATFTEGASRPATTLITVTFAGSGSGDPFQVEVADGIHDQPMNYLIDVTP